MNALDVALQDAVAQIPDCVAAGYVDLDSGMLLSIKTAQTYPRELLELLATATTDLFQGQNVRMIEQMFRSSRGIAEDGRHYFQEVMVNSDRFLHVFLRSEHQNHVVTFICQKKADLNVVLVKAREALTSLEDNALACMRSDITL